MRGIQENISLPTILGNFSKCLGCEANVICILRKGWFQPDSGIKIRFVSVQFSSVAQSCPTLRPHESQHARPPCPSPTPRVHSDSHIWSLTQRFWNGGNMLTLQWKKLRCRESLSYKANKWWEKDVNLGLSRSKGITLCITTWCLSKAGLEHGIGNVVNLLP